MAEGRRGGGWRACGTRRAPRPQHTPHTPPHSTRARGLTLPSGAVAETHSPARPGSPGIHSTQLTNQPTNQPTRRSLLTHKLRGDTTPTHDAILNAYACVVCCLCWLCYLRRDAVLRCRTFLRRGRREYRGCECDVSRPPIRSCDGMQDSVVKSRASRLVDWSS